MYKAFLTYKQMIEYLPFLLQNESIKHDAKDSNLRITNKGLQLLEMYNRLPGFVGKSQ
jgi:predicted transcriptional regulator